MRWLLGLTLAFVGCGNHHDGGGGPGPFTYNNGQCHVDGDGARLQVMPGPNVSVFCPGFSLAGGVRYVDYDRIAGTTNVVGADVATALACMTAGITDGGCPYFQTLEAAYRALSNPPPENAGFLRDDSLLVVVFLQDTDDCSAPLESPVFDLSRMDDTYGSGAAMRCAKAGIACGQPAAPLQLSAAGGPFTDCVPLNQADGGTLYDVQRYIDFFARPGGIKADPSDVILMSIAAPPSPFGWTETMPCSSTPNVASCAFPNPSCAAPSNPSANGIAAVRLAAVLGAGVTAQQSSICETDYSPAMAELAQKISARLR
jgi:hypothetical protein